MTAHDPSFTALITAAGGDTTATGAVYRGEARVAAIAEARRAQAAHSELVEQVMLWVDLLENIQRGEGRLDLKQLRPKIGKKLRDSAINHAVSVAALVADLAPDFAQELCEYAQGLGDLDPGGGA